MTATPSNAHIYSTTGSDVDTRPSGLARSASRASSSSRSTSQSLRGGTDTESNPTLSYFDQFAQEAKQRSNKRSSLLNELLLHGPVVFPGHTIVALTTSPSYPTAGSCLYTGTHSSLAIYSHSQTRIASAFVQRTPSARVQSHLTRAQSSSSLSSSLSALPGKWMATFMRTPAQGGARPALESIFQDPRAHAEPHHAQTLPAQPTFTHTNAFAASPPPSGLPATSSSLYSSSTLNHGASPFGPHVYVPPSGAPGYAGEGYGGRLWVLGGAGAGDARQPPLPGRTVARARAIGDVAACRRHV